MAMISGPMPAASPMVMPTGRGAVMVAVVRKSGMRPCYTAGHAGQKKKAPQGLLPAWVDARARRRRSRPGGSVRRAAR
ncbi:Uncharacterised protein [Bordetella pertussis]|nr:Uncharacterised protein [Bordetella pertussis]